MNFDLWKVAMPKLIPTQGYSLRRQDSTTWIELPISWKWKNWHNVSIMLVIIVRHKGQKWGKIKTFCSYLHLAISCVVEYISYIYIYICSMTPSTYDLLLSSKRKHPSVRLSKPTFSSQSVNQACLNLKLSLFFYKARLTVYFSIKTCKIFICNYYYFCILKVQYYIC